MDAPMICRRGHFNLDGRPSLNLEVDFGFWLADCRVEWEKRRRDAV
jgi:hypothetical protein